MAAASIGGADVAALMTTLGNAGALGVAAKFSVAFPLVYHFFGGLRHGLWDNYPELVQNQSVEQASWALFAASGVVTAGALAVSLPPAPKK